MLSGALIGMFVALAFLLIVNQKKKSNYEAIIGSLKQKTDYSANVCYANNNRYKKAMKIYDSMGALYLIGDTVYYQEGKDKQATEFNLKEYTVSAESDWRGLKWFSLTSKIGEKSYFTSYKLGTIVNDSTEVLRILQVLKNKKSTI
jgi:hypothetical protein